MATSGSSSCTVAQPCHRLAPAGMVKPRVMKSFCLPAMPSLDEKSVFKFSFCATFRLLFRSSCSASTLAVSDAVPSFLIAFDDGTAASSFGSRSGPAVTSAIFVVSSSFLTTSFFLFFPEFDAFFNECVRPVDCSLDSRSRRRSLSRVDVGSMRITLSAEYGSLH